MRYGNFQVIFTDHYELAAMNPLIATGVQVQGALGNSIRSLIRFLRSIILSAVSITTKEAQ